ncbi:MAG: PA2169 family four-helix-bundle protein [Terrimicrobiaceae bacterium]|nr:PA2169 family four-helix-bundle protein [Terrimicrobiaceae bacterium]
MSTKIKDLLQTLTDGVEGFTKAAESVKDPELKVLFQGFAAERQEMADELVAFSDADLTDEKSTVTGALHRGWINLQAALTSGDDHAILTECERGEDHAVEVFEKATKESFPAEASSTISSIATRILATHNKVRDLRDAAKVS